ncbi:MAG: DUF86 domain-containing protein, partial [Tannerella sp.]|nr:DUF86 domain-containing protein [Tannerella sp.]
MRNRVIHGYDRIDDESVWGAVVRHLPILKQKANNQQFSISDYDNEQFNTAHIRQILQEYEPKRLQYP